MDFEKYKRRVHRNGKDVGESLTNNTIAFIESTFTASPTYRRMNVFRTNKDTKLVETFEMDARVVEIERLGTIREILLRPNESLDVGTYVEFDNDTWLLYDKYGETGSTSVKLLAIKCNRKAKWIGRDGETKIYNCVASATDIGSKAKQSKNEIEWNKYDVRLPLGQLFMSLEYNEDTKDIRLNDRFIFGRNVYEVTGVDDISSVNEDGYGLIQFTIKITTIRENDDFQSGIAENIYNIEDGEQPTETTPTEDDTVDEGETGDGGMLW
jgi:hypothetical protein